MFISLICVQNINSNSYNALSIASGESVNFELPNGSYAYLIAENSIYGKVKAVAHDESGDKAVNLDDAHVTKSLKVEHKNTTFTFSEENKLRVWVIPNTTFNGKAIFANAETNFTFTSILPAEKSVSIFSTFSEVATTVNLTTGGSAVSQLEDPSGTAQEVSGETVTFTEKTVLIIQNEGETKLSAEKVGAEPSNECFGTAFKVLTESATISSDPSGITTSIVCPAASIAEGTIIGTGFPFVVLVLLIILVIFCIASGVAKLVSKNEKDI